MNKESKYELDLMRSLMGRMDKHLTLNESEFEKSIIKEMNGIGRIEYTDFDKFINEVDIPKGSLVGLGYIQGYPGSDKKIYPDADNFRATLSGEVSKIDPNGRLAQKMNKFQNNPEYLKPTGRAYGGFKSMASNDFAGVIKISNYVFNWDADSYKNGFNDKNGRIEKSRIEAGFGDDDANYAPDDWRRNPMYHGVGQKEVFAPSLNPDGSEKVGRYHNRLNPKFPVFGDNDEYGNPVNGKRVLKLYFSGINKHWTKYCLVDNNGEIDDVEGSLAVLFYKTTKGSGDSFVKKITAQMSADEQNLLKSLQEINNDFASRNKQFFIDNISYIVGKGKDLRTGDDILFKWINPNIDIDKVMVNNNEFEGIVNSEIQKLVKKVM